MPTSYLTHKNGRRQEVLAAIAGGTLNAGSIPALDANGRLTADMMPSGFGADADTLTASEALAAGAFVNVYDAGSGAFKVRNAVATGIGYEAHGYVLTAVAANGTASVMFDDNNSAVTAATPGPVYLSKDVPGGFTATSPTGAGVISQRLGVAVAAGVIHTAIEPATILAQ